VYVVEGMAVVFLVSQGKEGGSDCQSVFLAFPFNLAQTYSLQTATGQPTINSD
jgi:hypothetical protein